MKLHRNHLQITVNCFNEKYDKSIYRVFIEALFALYQGGLIVSKANSKKSLFSRLYFIARNFFTVKVDFRFDWNREKGIPILNKCRERTKVKQQYENTIYLTEIGSKYKVKIYDKAKDLERILEGIYFPIRLELTIKGFRPQNLKGAAKQIIERYEMEIQKGFCSIPEYPLISDFLDCVYWEDLVKGMDREELREAGVNKNQYSPAKY